MWEFLGNSDTPNVVRNGCKRFAEASSRLPHTVGGDVAQSLSWPSGCFRVPCAQRKS
jgi:hypothetical protein